MSIPRTEDACHRIKQVKTDLFSFMHEHDWAGDLNYDDRKWKQGIGYAIPRELMEEM